MFIKITGIHPKDAWYKERENIVGQVMECSTAPFKMHNGWFSVYAHSVPTDTAWNTFASIMFEEVEKVREVVVEAVAEVAEISYVPVEG